MKKRSTITPIFKYIFVLSILSGYVWAQTGENITLVGRWPDGPCKAVATIGTIAYIGNGGALDVLDVSRPDRPMPIARIVTPGVVNYIFVLGNYLYIANGKAGLRIVDITKLTSPEEIGFLETEGCALRVFVQGNHAYMAADTAGLIIIDISDPFAPEEVATVKVSSYTEDVFVAGNYAYVANSEEGLKIIDVREPSSPIEISTFKFDGPIRIDGVAVQEPYAYVLSTPELPLSTGALNIINVSNPDSLYEVGREIIVGDWASAGTKVVVKDSLAYAAFFSDVGNGLQIFNVRDPANPTTMGHYFTIGARDIFVDDNNLAYMADGNNGLAILDVSRPYSIQPIGHYDTPDISSDVVVLDRVAFVASDGLRVIDLTDASSPSQLGHFEISPYSWAGKVFVRNNLAFLATNASLRIIDISHPDSLFEVGSFGVLSRAVQVFDGYAFVLDRDKVLHIIDVSDPASPNQISEYETGGEKYVFGGDVFVSNNYVHVAEASTGLHILDISDISSPVKISGIEANGASLDVFVLQNHAYLAETRGLKIIDVSDPNTPRVLGQTDTSIAALSVFVVKNFAYVTTGTKGLRIIDVSDPEFPVEVGFFKTGDVALNVHVADDLIYVADHNDGLYILKNDLLTSIEGSKIIPQNFILHQNYPNPFNPETTIEYELAQPGYVQLTIYNLRGQWVRRLVDSNQLAGRHRIIWDGRGAHGAQSVASGVYVYELKFGDKVLRKKMVLLH